MVADTLNIDVEKIWEAQDNPSEHPGILLQISDVIENGTLVENAANNPHQGGSFEEFLKAEGIYDEVTARAVRRVVAALLKQRL